MYALAHLIPVRELVLTQALPIAIALVIAELFYRFGSFSLECLAFLATWFVLETAASAGAAGIRRVTGRRGTAG